MAFSPPKIAAALGAALLCASVADAGPGALDPTFGSGGKVTTAIGTSAFASGVVVQPDGAIVAAGGSSLGFALARYTSAGVLDPTFGTNGIVTTAISTTAVVAGLVLQADGMLVAAGWSSDGTNDTVTLARYQTNGALDPGFGVAGIVTTTVGTTSRAEAIVLQPDGKLVVAGRTGAGSAADFLLVRYDALGALDPTFGTGGVVTTAVTGFFDEARALARQADGMLVAAGLASRATPNQPDFALARYDANGALDPAFGSGGIVVTQVRPSGGNSVNAVVVQPDGRIVAAGADGNGIAIAIARYTAGGTLDATFATGGIFAPGGGGSTVTGVSAGLFQPPDAIILGGAFVTITGIFPSLTSNSDFLFSRMRDDTPAFDVNTVVDFGTTSDSTGAVAMQSTGMLVAAGGSGGKFALARYDASLCGNGLVEAAEECDDGNTTDGDGCDSNCTFTGCGNGIVTAGETCDDGNTLDGDCCSSACQIASPGAPCTNDGNACTDDVCDANAHCTHPANTAPCDDGDACTENDVCAAGECHGSAVTCPVCESCSPVDGSCIDMPQTQCGHVTVAGASHLSVRATGDPAKNFLYWKWLKGSVSGFGDPINTDDYTLCVYDESGASPAVSARAAAPHGGTCTGAPCWAPSGTSKFKYSDPDRTPDGIDKILLASGITGKSKVTLKARGANLAPPALPLGLPTRVQLQSSNGGCWEALFSAAGMKKNATDAFKGVGQ
ncbi:MAG: DUF4215 domain-containing protein [Deltaproteobacteria bacterium]|nr:MAG: DUF4215 domain-containing protein [Deltaproteobacteria bacterium]